ncbi:NmrA domain-containing protein [Mycena chlorophos]|uniref:NmrA domain-containing protein n=1 Tax=Mycena chlorophos TaxID=658473 RepID=A0A8H6W686_MYCCL|nr:NmrA domain-containing protein [Mycena chlorophos]
MTITQDSSAPLVAVVGATGAQGGSVVRALIESDKPYRVRIFTRDASKPAAKEFTSKGAEAVVVSITVDNKEAVYKAFEGADYVFSVTNWAEHGDPSREEAEGKLMVDAAKAAGVKGLVWSGLSSISALSGGKYPNVGHFESKARVTEYGRASGVPFVDIQGAGFTSSLTSYAKPTKTGADSWTQYFPVASTKAMAIIDAEHDYGLWVRKALELPVFPNGQSWAAVGEFISPEDQMKQLAEVTGKSMTYAEITPDAFAQGMESAGTPPHIVLAVKEVFTGVGEFGYFSKDTIVTTEGLARKPRTWKESVAAMDLSSVFA